MKLHEPIGKWRIGVPKCESSALKLICGKQPTKTLSNPVFRILIAPIPLEEIGDKIIRTI